MGKSGGASRRSGVSSKTMMRVAERKTAPQRAYLASYKRGDGHFFARFTKRPQEDIERDWTARNIQAFARPIEGMKSAWAAGGGGKARNYNEAVLSAVASREGDTLAYVHERWAEDVRQRQDEAVYRGQAFDRPKSMETDDHFVDRLADEYHIEVRRVADGSWVEYDHPGLAGFKVTVNGRADGHEPANALQASHAVTEHRQRYGSIYQSGEYGDATVGRVRYVADLGGNLHLFWAERVTSEEEARNA